MSLLPRVFLVVAGLVFGTTALADDDMECGMATHSTVSLVECQNPHDSPGPYTPPQVSFLIEQDASGVTAVLDNGITVDVDLEADGSFRFAVNGLPGNVSEVEAVIDASLSVDEQHAVSATLQPASRTAATDTLVNILGE